MDTLNTLSNTVADFYHLTETFQKSVWNPIFDDHGGKIFFFYSLLVLFGGFFKVKDEIQGEVCLWALGYGSIAITYIFCALFALLGLLFLPIVMFATMWILLLVGIGFLAKYTAPYVQYTMIPSLKEQGKAVKKIMTS